MSMLIWLYGGRSCSLRNATKRGHYGWALRVLRCSLSLLPPPNPQPHPHNPPNSISKDLPGKFGQDFFSPASGVFLGGNKRRLLSFALTQRDICLARSVPAGTVSVVGKVETGRCDSQGPSILVSAASSGGRSSWMVSHNTSRSTVS